jgi:hypothetical protein
VQDRLNISIPALRISCGNGTRPEPGNVQSARA